MNLKRRVLIAFPRVRKTSILPPDHLCLPAANLEIPVHEHTDGDHPHIRLGLCRRPTGSRWIEEAEDIQYFGDQYMVYMKRTKMFVPFLY
jgi:hypothetical protein